MGTGGGEGLKRFSDPSVPTGLSYAGFGDKDFGDFFLDCQRRLRIMKPELSDYRTRGNEAKCTLTCPNPGQLARVVVVRHKYQQIE